MASLLARFDTHDIGRGDMITPAKVDAHWPGLTFLGGLVGFEQTGTVAAQSTDTVHALVRVLGEPQRAFRVIHVTGTNGKGSTTAMIAALLRGQGIKVGAYASPHLFHPCERVEVDGTAITPVELDDALAQVARAAHKTGITPSWFEAMTVAAFVELARREVQVGVIEVGMLGRWDATNVVDGEVAVVTNVALDHTELAGPTRAHIAREKAGIIRPGATLILGERDDELRPLFAATRPARILEAGLKLFLRNGASGSVSLETPWGRANSVRPGMRGRHQGVNALTALAAAEALLDRQIPAEDVVDALAHVRVPGRLEVIRRDPTVLVDGAHNPAAARALRQALDEMLPSDSRRAFVLGVLDGHDAAGVLAGLGLRQGDLVVAAEPKTARALPGRELAQLAAAHGIGACVVAHVPMAIRVAMDAVGPAGSVVITGSLRMVAAAREELLGRSSSE